MRETEREREREREWGGGAGRERKRERLLQDAFMQPLLGKVVITKVYKNDGT